MIALLCLALVSTVLCGPLPNNATCNPPHCLRIVTIESPPFIVLETNYDDKGNELPDPTFDGYLMEFLENMKVRLDNFTYKIYVTPDNKYGIERDGMWQGMVGELVKGRADVALAPLTITALRSTSIRFSAPYMVAGIAPLVLKPNSGEMLPFRDVSDLVRNPRMAYGVIGHGSTHQFFRDNEYSLYQVVGDYIDHHARDVQATSIKEGIARVREGRYVFLGEEPMLKWYANRAPCDLMMVGNPINVQFYGLGFQKSADELAAKFTTAILAAQADGSLPLLENTWWESDCPAPKLCMCANTMQYDPKDSSESSSNEEEEREETPLDDVEPRTGEDNSGENELKEPEKEVEPITEEGGGAAAPERNTAAPERNTAAPERNTAAEPDQVAAAATDQK